MSEMPPRQTGLRARATVHAPAFTSVAMLACMFLFEFSKEAFLPKISKWESHSITILFSSAIATIAAWFVRRRFDRALGELNFAESASQQRSADLAATNEALRHETVAHRHANAALLDEMARREQAQNDLTTANQRLLETSRMAGMAEVANSVLHNVGNVLNSVNVSASLVAERLRATPLADLPRVVGFMSEHAAELGPYLTHDVLGRQVPGFLEMLAEHWIAEHREMVAEIERLQVSLQHIKEIVSRQQAFSGVSGVLEEIHLPRLIDDALAIGGDALKKRGVLVTREFGGTARMMCDRVKLTQILVNLITNAGESLAESGQTDGRLTLRTIQKEDGSAEIRVDDNGIGIAPEVRERLFTYGFTTKKTGHGFGLHASALAAQDMGATLRAESAGPGHGAVFIIGLPASRVASAASPGKESRKQEPA